MNFKQVPGFRYLLTVIGVSASFSILMSGCLGQGGARTRTRSALTEGTAPGSPSGSPSPTHSRTPTTTTTTFPQPPGSRAILRPEDIEFLGFYRLPKEAGDLWYADTGIALRKVNGQTRLFGYGNRTEGSPVYEFTLPADAPGSTVDDAPISPFVHDWGNIRLGRTITAPGNLNSSVPGGLYWDESRHALWWSYGDIYVPTSKHPNIGATILDDATGSWKSYGPWRTQWDPQRTRGDFAPIPAWFSSRYTNGKTVGLMSHQASGNAGSPYGAIISAIELPDPVNTPPDPPEVQTQWTIANQGLILHDLNHRQARDTNYQVSGWKVAYDCTKGGVLIPGTPEFGGPVSGVGENDTMKSMVWIDLPDKHGLLYFGMLVTTPEDYWAPGDPLGFVHMWYGNPFRSDGTPAQTDCYGQDDPYWGATGPGAHFRVPMGWIYNPDDLVATATGKADLWSRKPTSTFQWGSYIPFMKGKRFKTGIGSAVFDPSTRRIYSMYKQMDKVTVKPNSRPVLMVFQIK